MNALAHPASDTGSNLEQSKRRGANEVSWNVGRRGNPYAVL